MCGIVTIINYAGGRGESAEIELQRKVKQAGGTWNSSRKLWVMRYAQALELGLKDRIETPKISDSFNKLVLSETMISSLIQVR